jgi:DNA-binding LacI/PurR family transcriptional regulator
LPGGRGEYAWLRPSFINQFSAVIDLASQTNESLHRSLLVRRIAVLFLNREPALLQLHAVLLDRAHAASTLARDIFLAGHRRLLVIEASADTTVSNAARAAAQRYAPEAEVVSATIGNLSAITDRQNTAILCDGQPLAQEIRRLAEEYPGLAQVSLAAIGASAEQPFCTGVYTSHSEIALTATNLLTNAQANRPATIWLTGNYVDRGTIRAVPWQPFVGATRTAPTALSA